MQISKKAMTIVAVVLVVVIVGLLVVSYVASTNNEAWVAEDFDTFNRLNLQIYEGRVLLSGRVPNQAQADKAVQAAWKPEGVREVINEIEISDGGGLNDFANDTLINARLDADLLFDGDVNVTFGQLDPTNLFDQNEFGGNDRESFLAEPFSTKPCPPITPGS